MKTRWLGNVYILAVSLAFLCCSGKGWAQSCDPGNCLTTTATSATFVNTGAPAANASGETLSANTPTEWIAVQFTLANPAAITSIGGYFGSGTGGGLNVVIRTDNEADPTLPVPGSAIWSQTETIPSLGANSLVTFSNYLAVLAAGTYWVSFEPPTTSTLKSFMPGPPAPPGMAQTNNAFFVPTNHRWINFNEGMGHTTNYPAVVISGYDLGTASGAPLMVSGTFARTITQGTFFNTFPFSQNLSPIGNIGQAETNQWNIFAPEAVANAYGQVSANPKTTQGDIVEAGAYSATGTTAYGAARGIVFSTYLNTTGADISSVQVNAALSGSIFGASANSPVTVSAGVYVFDPAYFTTYINSVVPSTYATLAQFLLGGSNLVAGPGYPGQGSYYATDLTQLFNYNYVEDSWDSNYVPPFPLVCMGSCPGGYEVSTADFDLPANALFTVLFDVTAASNGAVSAQSDAIGDFLSTLQSDVTTGMFTDGSSANGGLGNPIAGIVGPIAVILPATPASIALSTTTPSIPVGSTATIVANVTDASNNPIPNAIVRFAISSGGPHAGFTGPVGTDSNGNATLTFTDTLGTGGTDSFSASVGTLSASTPADVDVTWTTPGPLLTISLSPANSTTSPGTGVPYTATGQDAFGTSLGNVNSSVTFNISPEGSCSGATCTPTATGPHTITATGSNPVIGTITGTTSLNVTSSSLSTPTITFGARALGDLSGRQLHCKCDYELQRRPHL